jgi:uncharacterized damage-inducible protein DinB
MDSGQVKELYEYNRWATARVFEAVSRLTPEEYTKDMQSSYRSVRDTFVHVIFAEWLYLQRVKKTPAGALWSPLDFPTPSKLKDRWVPLIEEEMAFVATLTDGGLKSPITYMNFAGEPYTYPLWQILQHVINHSSYHRGQITTMMRQLGGRPEASDFLLYYDMRAQS